MVELADRLTDAEALIALQARQLKELAVTQARTGQVDFTPLLDEIRQLLPERPAGTEASGELATRLEAIERQLASFPRALPVEHHHHVEQQGRGWVMGGVLLLVFTFLLAGGGLYQYRENTKLAGHSIKYRLLRLYYPKATHWADSLYGLDPDQMPQLLERLEERQLTKRPAKE
ncbi:hypothetical protein [Pontibacter mangrovi]|uniref:Uncharacterized protein n=1 Tax=Pontibacter mangrovi TaxID=2589816 RepID=A0A501VYX6_9BACT|nr:hypothetical protein [Pontibacter mangrovi]TPE39707.1 hypothetical protein FJM65_20695 [Pontibacter mangrovi]